MTRKGIALALVGLVALATREPRAGADPDDRAARQRVSAIMRDGIEAFLQGDFSRSGVLLEQAKKEAGCDRGADARCGRIELYVGLTRASEGDTEAARRAFERALTHDPALRLDPKRDKPSLVELFERVRARLAATSAPPAPASSPTTRPGDGAATLSATPAATPAPTPKPTRRRRLWTYVVAGTALAATAVGVGFALSASSDESDACALLAGSGDCEQRTQLLRAADRQRFEQLHDRGSTKTTVANVALVMAGALAAGALLTYWLEGRATERVDQEAAPPKAGPGGAGATARQRSWSLSPVGLLLRY